MQSTPSFLKNATFRQARRIAERWTHESRARGELGSRPPQLYQAYVCDGGPALDRTLSRRVSEFFEPPFSLDPQLADTREHLARLMAIVVKAHFFLFRMDIIQEEPLVFWVPDLLRPSKDRFGLYCSFLKSQRALIVSSADLALISSARLSLGRFPVALTDDSSQWFNERHWEALAREGDAARLLQDSLSISEARAAREHADESTFPFGRLFDVPSDLRSTMKTAGLRWADSLGKMYLPKGFDYLPVKAYFDHLHSEWLRASELSSLPPLSSSEDSF